MQNSFPQICEFKVHFEPKEGAEGCLDCIVELRVGRDEVPLGDEDCEIAFRKLTISVANEGLDILTHSRFGEPRKKNAVPLKNETTIIDKGKNIAGWGVNISSNKKPSVAGNLGHEAENATTNSRQYLDEGHYFRVKARPNDRWEVTEPAQQLLDDTYLCGDALFSAKRTKQPNRCRSSLSLKVKQRDLSISGMFADERSKTFFGRMNENQKRLLDIFICKSLSQLAYADRRYAGELVLAEVERDFFDED